MDQYKLSNPDLVQITDADGNTIFISPFHPKYKELKQLEAARADASGSKQGD